MDMKTNENEGSRMNGRKNQVSPELEKRLQEFRIWAMNKEIKKKASNREEFVNRILDSWIGKTLSFVAYHLLWRIFIKKGEEQ